MSGGTYAHGQFILQRPECAALIGAIAVEWSGVEQTLAFQFGMLVFGVRTVFDGGEPIAAEVMEAAQSTQHKRNLLMIAAKRRFPPQTVEQYDNLLNDVQDAGAKRSLIIHGRWSLSANEPDKLVFMRQMWQHDKAALYGPAELRAVLDEIGRSVGALHWFFYEKMLPELKTLPERYVQSFLTVQEMLKKR